MHVVLDSLVVINAITEVEGWSLGSRDPHFGHHVAGKWQPILLRLVLVIFLDFFNRAAHIAVKFRHSCDDVVEWHHSF